MSFDKNIEFKPVYNLYTSDDVKFLIGEFGKIIELCRSKHIHMFALFHSLFYFNIISKNLYKESIPERFHSKIESHLSQMKRDAERVYGIISSNYDESQKKGV